MMQVPIDIETGVTLDRWNGGRCWWLIGTLSMLVGCTPEAPPAAVAPPAQVSVSRPLIQSIADSIEYTGSTAPLEKVDVISRVTGFLTKVHFTPRQRVEAGTLLFTIDKSPFEIAVASAQSGLDAKIAQLEKAQYEYDWVKDLFEKKSAADKEVRDAKSVRDTLAAAKADHEARLAQAKLELSWCEVRAPFGGRMSRHLLDPGNIVNADTTVMTNIVNDDQMYVYFNASERDLLMLREQSRRDRAVDGKPATSQPEFKDIKMPVFVGLMTETGFPHKGMIDYAAPAVDSTTGTQQVRAVLPNADGVLLAGLFVRVRIPIGDERQVPTVTERALGSDQGQRFVYVVNDKNVVEYRPVTIGTLRDGLRVINAGLKPEDRVIVLGIQRVRPGLTVNPIDVPMPVLGAESTSAANTTTAPASVKTESSSH